MTDTIPETLAPGAGAVMEIVGAVDDDEFVFFPLALAKPTQPSQSNNKIVMKQQANTQVRCLFSFCVNMVDGAFIRVTPTEAQLSWRTSLHHPYSSARDPSYRRDRDDPTGPEAKMSSGPKPCTARRVVAGR